jgi:hypothetical protein
MGTAHRTIRGSRLTGDEQGKIKALHERGLSPRKIGDAIGRSRSGVLKFLVRKGLLIQKKGGRVKHFSAEEDNFLKEHYPARGGKWCAGALGRHPSTVRSRAMKIGVKLTYKNATHRKLSEEDIRQAVKLYSADKRCAADIAGLLGVKIDCIYNHLRANGVTIRKGAFGARKRILWSDRKERSFKMRSIWEIATAHWLDQRGVDWDYERESYRVVTDKKAVSYTPDFWIYDDLDNLELIVDVKGAKRASQLERIELLEKQRPDVKITLWDYGVLVSKGILRGPREAPPVIVSQLKEELRNGTSRRN